MLKKIPDNIGSFVDNQGTKLSKVKVNEVLGSLT